VNGVGGESDKLQGARLDAKVLSTMYTGRPGSTGPVVVTSLCAAHPTEIVASLGQRSSTHSARLEVAKSSATLTTSRVRVRGT
jgi:hypothetical protein